ncbi:hypothetical protein [Haladaptatus salinisoli]|uniref:hypothetical protein n=1 Tax=Haladaptatus salinisoli TaxID=2884876 RepID=UPI001D0BE339|nr:hypothetical protein [Haladaptatus salinisoli]
MSSDRPAELADDESIAQSSTDELAAQVALLTEENQRLRAEYVRARQAQHRRAALGMAALGGLAAVAAVLLPDSRPLLLALAGTGFFAAVLTYYLTPQQFVSAEVGERVYASAAAMGASIVDDLGLQDERVYVPTESDGNETFANVRLFLPQHADYVVPDGDELISPFVVTNDERGRGASFFPTGAALFREFETTMTNAVPDEPEALAGQLTDAVVEGFELVDSASADVDRGGTTVTVGVRGSAYGSVTRFDHPVASFIATGMAKGLDAPVTVEQLPADDDRFDYLVSCDWTEATERES